MCPCSVGRAPRPVPLLPRVSMGTDRCRLGGARRFRCVARRSGSTSRRVRVACGEGTTCRAAVRTRPVSRITEMLIHAWNSSLGLSRSFLSGVGPFRKGHLFTGRQAEQIDQVGGGDLDLSPNSKDRGGETVGANQLVGHRATDVKNLPAVTTSTTAGSARTWSAVSVMCGSPSAAGYECGASRSRHRRLGSSSQPHHCLLAARPPSDASVRRMSSKVARRIARTSCAI